MNKGRVLIVEDDASLRRITQMQLDEAGYETVAVEEGWEALEAMRERGWDLVLTDLRMKGMGGVELLREIKKEWPETGVILITAYGTIENAVEAMKAGAYDYITKPVHFEELEMVVERAIDHQRLRRENWTLRRNLERKYGFESILGKSRSLMRTLDLASRAAQSESTVLIEGETGTGKELLARAIHNNSRRSGGPFVAINCGAIPKELIESELFGHKKGAFTGAVATASGRVEQANGGTLFLDEVGEMPAELQIKLLRLVQNREIEKVGAGGPTLVDVRILAATNRNLEAMVEDGRFREDLYYRLAVIPLRLPPLRERQEDIEELAREFFGRMREKQGREELGLSDEVIECIRRHRWPGNVRELENLMERVVVLARGPSVELEDLPEGMRTARTALEELRLELPEEGIQLDAVERELISRALRRCKGNQTGAAQYLDISRKTLIYRMEKHGLEREGWDEDNGSEAAEGRVPRES